MKNRILVCLLSILLFSCGDSKVFTTTEDSINYISVDIEQLLEDPNRFNGKYIELSGIFVYEFENVGIYKTRMAAYRKDSKNAFWTEFEEGLLTGEELEGLKNKRIVVRGLVSERKGHLMQFAGTLKKVNYLKY
ncbi:hypothetical protein [Rufibacter sp. LB8]|uniref:hypothetical protein n=1 Tax=Rufibacter sp. LB8 TaxID=2777781 RepID=UPI00178C5077|nr:hypothetical protein [Rufibacter sp. LB8]